MQTSNEKSCLTKKQFNSKCHKALKQVADMQCDACTFLMHFVQLYSKVDQGYTCRCIALHVSNLFQCFCGSPNYIVLCLNNFVITCRLLRL